MTKIKLGQRPESFKAVPVAFKMPDGSDGAILATFKYRTQEEYGALLNESKTPENQPLPTVADGTVDFQTLYGNGRRANAEFLLKALVAWDLDEPLNAENLQAVGNEYPAAIHALTNAYGLACREGKLGN